MQADKVIIIHQWTVHTAQHFVLDHAPLTQAVTMSSYATHYRCIDTWLQGDRAREASDDVSHHVMGEAGAGAEGK